MTEKTTKFTVRTDNDVAQRLTIGFESIVDEFEVREDFPAEVTAEACTVAETSSVRNLTDDPQRADLSALPFVTLDPAASTDLDQAFCIEAQADDTLLLYYAIADVGAFVPRGSALETEAWQRGETIYAPHRRIPLYPPVLCEGAASLLPGGRKPAIVMRVQQSPDGEVVFRGAHRSVIESRAKLAYETVDMSAVPHLVEFARRSELAEERRGAMRSDLPEQELHETDDGHFELELRSLLPSENANAALSLSANLAAAAFLESAGVGLFRVMDMPDDNAVRSLRRLASALHLEWPSDQTLGDFQRTLEPTDPRHRAMLVSARRAGGGASYATLGCDLTTDVAASPVSGKGVPFHAAIAGTYLHATAPLRRLADRYVLDLLCDLTDAEGADARSGASYTSGSAVDGTAGLAVLAVLAAAGAAVTGYARHTLAALPAIMRASGSRAARVGRAAVDLAEAVTLESRVGQVFTATVLEAGDTGVVFQVAVPPVRARLNRSAIKHGAVAGAVINVRLDVVDVATRSLSFSLADGSGPTPERVDA